MKKLLFLGKKNDVLVDRALEFCLKNFDTTVCLSEWGTPLPESAQNWEGDYIISYLCRWIVPQAILNKPKLAINFHPAPPTYPGFGPVNFALYEKAKEYGVTCHHMAAKVDTGKVIKTSKFAITEEDTVESVLKQTYQHQIDLFFDIITYLVNDQELPEDSEFWSRKPFTRKDFNALNCLSVDMNKEEMLLRIKAFTFGQWKPELKLHDLTFTLKE